MEEMALDVFMGFMGMSVGVPLELQKQHMWGDMKLTLVCAEVRNIQRFFL